MKPFSKIVWVLGVFLIEGSSSAADEKPGVAANESGGSRTGVVICDSEKSREKLAVAINDRCDLSKHFQISNIVGANTLFCCFKK